MCPDQMYLFSDFVKIVTVYLWSRYLYQMSLSSHSSKMHDNDSHEGRFLEYRSYDIHKNRNYNRLLDFSRRKKYTAVALSRSGSNGRLVT